MAAAVASDAKSPLTIGVIVFDGVVQLDYIGVTSYLEQLPTAGQPVKFLTISLRSGPLRCANALGLGMPLFASHGYQDVAEKLDILVIPGGRGRVELQKDEGFMRFVRSSAEQATFVLTVCTGSAILAATGFLDGRRATTNKIAYQGVVDANPGVQWVHKARWVEDGNVWTSSGVTAGLDMAYAFVSREYGKPVADGIARYIESVPNTDASNDPFATL
ncbi:hypothetical protein BBJ28_00025199 [Nothophytophthora sp. Chile5]|nr:hypothetical protein BBJ28_00025199 [Nothophytophthora sp. Chile5]